MRRVGQAVCEPADQDSVAVTYIILLDHIYAELKQDHLQGFLPYMMSSVQAACQDGSLVIVRDRHHVPASAPPPQPHKPPR